MKIVVFKARKTDELASLFSAIFRQRADALNVLPDGLLFTQRKELATHTTEGRLPSIFETRQFVDAGGLMSYGISMVNLWRRAALYVDKILKSAKPADLAIEQPTKFEFVINLKAAKQSGIVIPPHVLARADAIIR